MAGLTKEEQKRRAELLAKGLKVCFKCGRELPVEQFSKDKTTKDGLNRKCKECRKQYNQQHYQEHKEEILQYVKQYDEEHKEERQQYYEEHKQERQQYQQQYNQTPEGQVIKFNSNAKRRKREELQGAGINKEQWLEMMQFFDWKCAYSGVLVNTKNNRSIDHIIPIVKGGEHEVWNCVPMYANYNFSKKEKDIMEWYTAQDFYNEEKLDKIYEWQQYAYNKYGKQEEAQ